ncbi:MAG: porin [Alphaproteobacteria bacterium]|nr:porin [Alphaproteobacteria bacterium]
MNKQKLLATTALVSLFAGSALADGAAAPMVNDMSVRIGGNFDGHAITASDSSDVNNLTKNNNDLGFSTDAEVWLEAKSSTAKGLEYGAHIGISTHANSYKNTSKGSDRSYLWLEHHDLGRMEFGSNNDSSESMRVGADSIAVATGGISGAWVQSLTSRLFSPSVNVSLEEFVMSPWNVGDNAMDFDLQGPGATTAANSSDSWHVEKARKATYYTPRMNGFQFGLSYTPDTENRGNGLAGVISQASLPNSTSSAANAAANKNVFSGGITWDGKVMNDVMGSVSLVGMTGSTAPGSSGVESKDVEGMDFGVKLNYRDWRAAASYGWLGETGFQSAATNIEDTHYWTFGLGYKMDKIDTSLSYMWGTKNHNESQVVSLGVDYALASGIMPYAEATYYHLDLKNRGGLALTGNGANPGTDRTVASTANTTVQRHAEGTVFVLGTKLKF